MSPNHHPAIHGDALPLSSQPPLTATSFGVEFSYPIAVKHAISGRFFRFPRCVRSHCAFAFQADFEQARSRARLFFGFEPRRHETIPNRLEKGSELTRTEKSVPNSRFHVRSSSRRCQRTWARRRNTGVQADKRENTVGRAFGRTAPASLGARAQMRANPQGWHVRARRKHKREHRRRAFSTLMNEIQKFLP